MLRHRDWQNQLRFACGSDYILPAEERMDDGGALSYYADMVAHEKHGLGRFTIGSVDAEYFSPGEVRQFE
jgi:hypothetical protein